MNHNLKLAILRSGKRQHQIASEIQSTETRVSRIVLDRVEATDEEKEAFAKALGTTVESLFGTSSEQEVE